MKKFNIMVTEQDRQVLQAKKDYAKAWAQKIGLLPVIDEKTKKASFRAEFIDKNGKIQSRKKTVNGRINSSAFLQIATTGFCVTKKVIKERKKHVYKPTKKHQEFDTALYAYIPTPEQEKYQKYKILHKEKNDEKTMLHGGFLK